LSRRGLLAALEACQIGGQRIGILTQQLLERLLRLFSLPALV
jgi:hypothetical protein